MGSAVFLLLGVAAAPQVAADADAAASADEAGPGHQSDEAKLVEQRTESRGRRGHRPDDTQRRGRKNKLKHAKKKESTARNLSKTGTGEN